MKTKTHEKRSGTNPPSGMAKPGRDRTRTADRPPARRDVLALGAAAAVGLASPAIAQTDPEPIVWSMATAWPRKAPGYFSAAERLAKSITLMSGGRLQVTAYGAGEKAAAEKMFNAVSNGTIELGHSSAHLWTDINPAFQFFTGIPFGMTAVEHAGWIRFGGGQSLWNQAYAAHGIRPFLAGNTGLQGSGWYRREIRNPEDFNGLKIRISGIGADVLRHLGAEPVDLPPSEIFPAMQSEQIDAVKLAGPWNDLNFGLHKLARYYYLPAFDDVGYALELVVNTQALEALPPDLQAIVAEAANAASAQTLAEFTYNNILALDLMETRTSTIVGPFSDNVVRALDEATDKVIDTIGASSRFARTIQSSYFGHLFQAVDYASASDFIVLRQRQAVQK